MDKELSEALKYLRLPGQLSHWDEYLKLASKASGDRQRLMARELRQLGLQEH
jgi:hypothetical protein